MIDIDDIIMEIAAKMAEQRKAREEKRTEFIASQIGFHRKDERVFKDLAHFIYNTGIKSIVIPGGFITMDSKMELHDCGLAM